VKDTALFHEVAEFKDLPSRVKSGHYRMEPGISLNRMINKFAGGLQDPVNVTFHNTRTLAQMAGKVSKQLEADSIAIMKYLNDSSFMDSINTSRQELPGYFIPNTYEFYWNTGAKEFVKRMLQEHDDFWNRKRRKQASDIGLTPNEISTLASIVQEETNQQEEMDRIAGVYINRLEKGMLLQADPTLKYAWQDWSMRRVLNRHKTIDSPYNTYKYKGLPPGPISMPEPRVIDKVLQYEKHDYIFFVARPDNSGLHDFSKTLGEHVNKARKYHRKLNRERIYR
jgi:UPF0755 protein